jgi:two-component system sensor histidine kinase MprB
MPGSGLGLAIVKQVAESHGGDVVVERPADGGTRMRLRLTPAAGPDEPSRPPTASSIVR